MSFLNPPKLFGWLILVGLLICTLTGCSIPRVSAEERLFLDVSLDFLGSYEFPKTEFEGTLVGGLSGMTYDRERDRFYVISDDRSNQAPARFYTLKLEFNSTDAGEIGFSDVAIEKVTVLTGEDRQPYAAGSIDLEGIARSPRQSVFITSEGVAADGIAPFIDEFDLETGAWKQRLPIPTRFLPQTVENQIQGVQNNRGFESLSLNPINTTTNWQEPFRLFAATESAIAQDLAAAAPETPPRLRFLHYLIGETQPTLIAEHLYILDPPTIATEDYGLAEILTIDQAGHFLTLERSFSLAGFNAHLFQAVIAGATDTSGFPSLKGDIAGVEPIRKRSLLDFSTLGVPIDNLEGMTLGPYLPDGTQSLILISDDNFNELQTTQLLLFRLQLKQ